MRDLLLVAGSKGLTSSISKVTVLDAPDGPSWLSGGEFILTSTYLFNNDSERLCLFCEQLINIKASGFGLKMGRYLSKVPQSLIDLCDRNNFPLIILPYSFVWTDVISVFYELSYDLEREEKYSTIKSKLVAQIRQTNNQSVERVAEKVYSFFATPIMFLDAEGVPIFCAGTAEEKERLRGVAEAFFKDGLDFHRETFSQDQYFSIDMCKLEKFNAKYVVFSSVSRNIIGELRDILTEVNIIADEKNIEYESENELISRALEALLMGDRVQPGLLEALNGAMLQDGGFYCIVYVRSCTSQQIYAELSAAIQKFAPKEARSFMVFSPIKLESLIVLRFYGRKQYYDVVMTLRKIVFDLSIFLSDEEVRDRIYVSNLFDSYNRVEQCYREARVTADYSEIMWKTRNLCSFEEVFPYYLMANSDVSPMYFDGIEKLENAEESATFSYMATLESYLRNGSFKKAAKELFIHENTLRYRIKKIGELISADFDDTATCQNYVIRVNLWKLKRGLHAKGTSTGLERIR